MSNGTNPQPVSRQWWPRILLLALIAMMLLAFFARIIPGERTVDDAFITFRYSRNVVAGDGFVYNAGNRVLGTTTPLYALSLSSVALIFGNNGYPTYALVINALADSIIVAFLALLVVALGGSRWLGVAVGAMWALAPYSVSFAIGGMETSVHNLWMVAAWLAYVQRWHPAWIGAFVACGILTRPDAVIWAGPLLLHQLFMTWRQRGNGTLWRWLPWQTYVTGLVIGLPWTIFAALYFGSPIPHTVGTKSVVYQVEDLQALVRLLQHYATPLHQHELIGLTAGIGLGLVLFPSLALIALRKTTQHSTQAWPILTYPWLYFAVFALLNPLIFRWYLTPPLPAYYMAIALGAAAFLQELFKTRQQAYRLMSVVLIGCSLVSLLSAWELSPGHGPERPAPKMAFHELELNYQRMAERLVAEYGVDGDTLIAIGDIGAFGYYSRARILDTVGLVTEDLNGYYDTNVQAAILAEGANYAIPPDMIFDFQPAFIVTMADFVTEGLLKDARFAETYNPEPIFTIETDYYGDAMWVFARRDMQPNIP